MTVKRGKWRHNSILSILHVLSKWAGPLPSWAGICEPEEDLTYMLAYYGATGKMNSWDDMMTEQEYQRRSTASKAKPAPKKYRGRRR